MICDVLLLLFLELNEDHYNMILIYNPWYWYVNVALDPNEYVKKKWHIT